MRSNHLNAAARSAKAAEEFKKSTENLAIDMNNVVRPWLSPKNTGLVVYEANATKVRLGTEMINSGKTPALDIFSNLYGFFAPAISPRSNFVER